MHSHGEFFFFHQAYPSKSLACYSHVHQYADISGFTSWSSSREPAQVFILLQNIYAAFDEVARKRHMYVTEWI